MNNNNNNRNPPQLLHGGVLSPLLFAIFIDNIVSRVKSVNVGCYISLVCCCIFLYADDILLVAPTVTGLQTLLNVCEQELIDLDMRVNVKKSNCIRFGKRFNEPCAELASVHGGSIKWVDSCRYLGVPYIFPAVAHSDVHWMMLNLVSSVHLMLCLVK